jgi:dynactin complex subunit|tara:strand:- start:2328 stop:2579 length:252 start_codon:yes stop_codon:yes gene_type:complete
MSHTAIEIIKIKREEYKARRIKTLEIKTELENEGKNMDAKIVDLTIDNLQNTIHDLTEMIEEIKNITAYEKSCIDLINNQFKK